MRINNQITIKTMESKIFLFQDQYVRLNNGVLTSMTASEVELYCSTNRETLIVFFQLNIEAAPEFFTHIQGRVKVINLTNNTFDTLLVSYYRELFGCFDIVMTWLADLHPDKGSILHIADMVKPSRI